LSIVKRLGGYWWRKGTPFFLTCKHLDDYLFVPRDDTRDHFRAGATREIESSRANRNKNIDGNLLVYAGTGAGVNWKHAIVRQVE
jgi:hypothetical protein